MMDTSPVIQKLQQQFGLSLQVAVQSTSYFRKAVGAQMDVKHNQTVVACAALYIYCRRNGINMTMAQICSVIPITREELMNAYEDVRKVV